VLTAAGARGALWDPRRSAEENTALRYAADAADLLRQCGLDAQAESLQEGGSDEAVTSPPARVTSASKIASRDVTPCCRRGADVDNEDLLSPQVKKPDRDLSQASTEACDSDLSLNNEAAPPSPSPVEAQRSLQEAETGAQVTEEAPPASQMCQASGILGLPTCWFQLASGR
jgi:hypothetical protein